MGLYNLFQMKCGPAGYDVTPSEFSDWQQVNVMQSVIPIRHSMKGVESIKSIGMSQSLPNASHPSGAKKSNNK